MATATCNQCGVGGFTWKSTPNGARLVNPDGTMHHIDGEPKLQADGSYKVYVEYCTNRPLGSNQGPGITLSPGAGTAISDDRMVDAVKKAEQSLQMAVQMTQQVSSLGIQFGQVTEELTQKANRAMNEVSELDKRWQKRLDSFRQVEIRVKDKPAVNVGRQHAMFEHLLKLVITVQGEGVVFLKGEPGSMKTSVLPALAKALDVPYYLVSMNNQTSRSELLGYMSGNGEYVTSPAYLACKHGGIVMYDEVDASNANGLTGLNTLATNNFVGFPNGETVQKHPQCYVIAAGNTIGAGNDSEFVGRNQLDMASRTRFIYVDWQTDWELVAEIVAARTGSDDWAMKVKMLHDVVIQRSIKFVVSSRVALVGANMIANGFNEDQVLTSMVWPNMSTDEKRVVLAEVAKQMAVVNQVIEAQQAQKMVKPSPMPGNESYIPKDGYMTYTNQCGLAQISWSKLLNEFQTGGKIRAIRYFRENYSEYFAGKDPDYNADSRQVSLSFAKRWVENWIHK